MNIRKFFLAFVVVFPTVSCESSSKFGGGRSSGAAPQSPKLETANANPADDKACAAAQSSTQDCPIPNGSGKQTRMCSDDQRWEAFGACSAEKCDKGHHPKDGACVKECDSGQTATDACSIADETGTQSRTCQEDGVWGAYGECSLSDCELGFYRVDGRCVRTCEPGTTETEACPIFDGAGTKKRFCGVDGRWGAFGACGVTKCDAGYGISANECVMKATCVWSLVSITGAQYNAANPSTSVPGRSRLVVKCENLGANVTISGVSWPTKSADFKIENSAIQGKTSPATGIFAQEGDMTYTFRALPDDTTYINQIMSTALTNGRATINLDVRSLIKVCKEGTLATCTPATTIDGTNGHPGARP